MPKSKGKKGRKVEEEVLDEELEVEDEDLDVEDIDLDDEDDDDIEELDDEAPTPKKSKKSKPDPKKTKKVDGPKKSKKGQVPKHMQVPDNMVTVKDLEDEYNMTGKTIRTILRDKEFERPEGLGRWAWKKSDPQLKELRKILAASGGKKEAAPKKEEKAATSSKKDKKKKSK